MTQEEIDAEQALMAKQQAEPQFNFERAAEQAPVISDEAAHAVTPLDLLNSGNYTDRATRDTRMDICNGCDRLFKPTKSCKECGCFMALKTWIEVSVCPIGKW